MIIKKYYKLVRVSHEDSEYLSLKNVSNENGTFKMVRGGLITSNRPNLEYSLDGVTWTTYDMTNLPEVTVTAGNSIYLRGTNSNNSFQISDTYFWKISFNKLHEAHGNMCSLINPDPSTVTTLGNSALYGLFNGDSTLTTAPSIGSVNSFGVYSMTNCFRDCTSLTTVPDFSNLTYIDNFSLGACFWGCTSLTTGVDLSNVTSVGIVPFEGLYKNCTSLTTATSPNLQDLNTTLLNSWLDGAGTSVPAGTTKIVNVPTGATIATDSTSGIPTGWTRVDY